MQAPSIRATGSRGLRQGSIRPTRCRSAGEQRSWVHAKASRPTTRSASWPISRGLPPNGITRRRPCGRPRRSPTSIWAAGRKRSRCAMESLERPVPSHVSAPSTASAARARRVKPYQRGSSSIRSGPRHRKDWRTCRPTRCSARFRTARARPMASTRSPRVSSAICRAGRCRSRSAPNGVPRKWFTTPTWRWSARPRVRVWRARARSAKAIVTSGPSQSK